MGGGSFTPFYEAGNKDVSCEDLNIKTQLSSPQVEVVNELDIGDILELKLLSQAGPCLAIFEGRVAGTIINKELRKIVDCMNAGRKFNATVRSIEGGKCSITIKHRP